jgi:hypothetical protein
MVPMSRREYAVLAMASAGCWLGENVGRTDDVVSLEMPSRALTEKK